VKELSGKVAVVTGAASGIGRGLATRFAAEGMKVVLADVERGPLDEALAELRAAGAEALAVPTDVSDGAAVAALAARTIEAFGAAHVICNNAGVGGGVGPMWTLPESDWSWVLGVNLWGVIHGVRAFVPGMVAQGEGHVINTASQAGLASPPTMGPYVATKHAVVALSEVLCRDLQMAGSAVKVSVLCPGFVRTRIAESQRNRPAHLAGAAGPQGAVGQAVAAQIQDLVAGGLAPEVIAEQVVAAIRDERFYVMPSPGTKEAVQHRMEDILGDRTPALLPLTKPSR
jgi:NAD(P)-dependent dehydrogenase (short-subunit alcohol dehydrogenase family)